MITVKMLRPYYLKVDKKMVHVVLAYQYFSLLIDNQVYQFVPLEANEILVNRHTKAIENIRAKFAFQNGEDVIYKTMYELITYPDFIFHLHLIVKPYFNLSKVGLEQNDEIDQMIYELERMNLKRRIDQALDERDKALFLELVKHL
ncbi:hypothetical protein HNQ35_000367 [Cerasibacillus quisquiliarum]|uniref:IDEAL domain-containing protein n=1 Tax=Cerasibacillus quisquiliarum TaxID=227865 RepID=A0A511UXS2_9BACI|nr:IDEAL domain-containing protein [Cerasibacillus quisquiliarum]MBB5145178.1 hypothetical protein [Cerasibacillus quisquiliarum]GEN29932.1 hypothetical protein CQU01_01700 [Cerasibacillus quisquiliarum]